MGSSEVVISGIGIVGPLGCTTAEFVSSWRNGAYAERAPLPGLAGTPLAAATVAAMPAFDPAERLGGRRMLKYMSDGAVLGCVAAREALADSCAAGRFSPEEIGIFAATGLASADVRDVLPAVEQSIDESGSFSAREFGRRGLAATNPLLSFKILPNMPPCLVSVIENIKGPNLIFGPWEGHAGAAIQEGWCAVAEGRLPCALVGGADTPSSATTFAYLRQARHLREDEYAGAGAAYLVLERAETLERVGRRGRAVLAAVSIIPSAVFSDFLSRRIGRTYAAAPAIATAVAACCGMGSAAICGVDQQRFDIKLESLS